MTEQKPLAPDTIGLEAQLRAVLAACAAAAKLR
jgi:hypothetical protein